MDNNIAAPRTRNSIMTSVTPALPMATPMPNPRPRTLVLWGIVAIEVLALCLPAKWWGIAGLSLLVLAVLFGVLLSVLRGRGEVLVLAWVLIFPLGYYFLSFPREHSLITLDRVFVAVLLVTTCFADHARVTPIPDTMRKSAVWWAVFLLFAVIAVPRAKTPLNSLRLWLEAFVFPALLAWYVLRYFEIRKHLSTLHILTCVMTLYVAAIGVGEIVTQQDLLPLPDGDIYVAGDTRGQLPTSGGFTDFLVRPNGPFSTNNTFAMNGLVSLFFLLFLKQALRGQMPAWQSVLHRIGTSAALAETVMPFFRSVLVSLVVVLMVDMLYQHGRRRAMRAAAILGLASVFLLLRVTIPEAFEDRTDPANIYGRVAQQRQTIAMFFDHPLNGVGLNNFNEAAQNSKYTAVYKDLESVDYPHNNLGAILVETGLLGFVPFVVSQGLIFMAFWKLSRENSADSKFAWKAFLFIFLCYWINGMSLTIAYFEDLNLWYMLVLSLVYKYSISAPKYQVFRTQEP